MTDSRLKRNIISAISPSGLMRYMTYDASMNAILFIDFLKQIIASANGKMIFLIVDNLKTCHSKLVDQFIKANSNQIRMFYLPPYCPDLNLDEYLNNVIITPAGKC
jgi:transposase